MSRRRDRGGVAHRLWPAPSVALDHAATLEEREAAEHEIARLRARAEEVQGEVAAFDLDEEAASRLAALRQAIAGEVVGAESLTAVRTALGRVFSKVTLVRTRRMSSSWYPRSHPSIRSRRG